MHKILFYNKFISCLYVFRAHVLIIRRSKLYYTASGIITPIGGCDVTGALLSNEGHYKMYLLKPRFLVFIPGIRDALK